MDSMAIVDNRSCNECHRLAEADHRIANHLAMLGGYVRLKSKALVKRKPDAATTEALLLIKAIAVQIDAVSTLHRMLAGQGPTGQVSLNIYLGTVCAAMRSAVAGDVDIVEDFRPGCTLSADHMLPVAQIVTEVMTNAIKHGAGASGAVSLKVSCGMDDLGGLVMSVSDSGPGLPSSNLASGYHGLGFRIVDKLLAQVEGRIAYLSDANGLTVRLSIPAATGSSSC